jgi:hypothetical protein
VGATWRVVLREVVGAEAWAAVGSVSSSSGDAVLDFLLETEESSGMTSGGGRLVVFLVVRSDAKGLETTLGQVSDVAALEAISASEKGSGA